MCHSSRKARLSARSAFSGEGIELCGAIGGKLLSLHYGWTSRAKSRWTAADRFRQAKHFFNSVASCAKRFATVPGDTASYVDHPRAWDESKPRCLKGRRFHRLR